MLVFLYHSSGLPLLCGGCCLIKSTGDTDICLRRIANDNPWIKVVHQQNNIGFEGQLEFIADIVNTQYLWILGDDDCVAGDLGSLSAPFEFERPTIFLPHISTKEELRPLPSCSSVEEFLNFYKGGFQFISSWIVASTHYVTWLKVAKQYGLEDPQCLINLASISLSESLYVSNDVSILPLPSFKTYTAANSDLSTLRFFWQRPRAAVAVLNKNFPLDQSKLVPYKRWEDIQLLRVLYVSIRDRHDLAAKSLYEAPAYANCIWVKFLLIILRIVPTICLGLLPCK